MILGIDASNLRAGGGVTHLVELLKAADPSVHGFSRVIVWSGKETLDWLEDRTWLEKSHQPLLDKSLPVRVFWQRFRLSALARRSGCAVLFIPGGSYDGDFHPIVAMSRNLLPFEWRELSRFGWSWLTLKLVVLRAAQKRTFRRADGLIFLTAYAKNAVMGTVKTTAGKITTVPHGIDKRFFSPPRKQLPLEQCSLERPLRIIYVSIIDVYKHQWHVAQAVVQLKKCGLPVMLELVGRAYPPALRRLQKTLSRIDPAGECVRYSGPVAYEELHTRYREADICVFASSCENMPNILLEGMASGLPIACSNRGPMPQILGNAGVYFDPENPRDIFRALKELIDSSEIRTEKSRISFQASQAYSWARCAKETFQFLASVAVKDNISGSPAQTVKVR